MALSMLRTGPEVFRIKQGDTMPWIEKQLVDVDYIVQSFIGATLVEFIYRKKNAAAATAVVRVAEFVSPDHGQVRYRWVEDDTAVAGEYVGEFRVTLATGHLRTFPQRGYYKFVVEKDLNT